MDVLFRIVIPLPVHKVIKSTKIHSVHWGINPPLFRQAPLPLLNLETVQAPTSF